MSTSSSISKILLAEGPGTGRRRIPSRSDHSRDLTVEERWMHRAFQLKTASEMSASFSTKVGKVLAPPKPSPSIAPLGRELLNDPQEAPMGWRKMPRAGEVPIGKGLKKAGPAPQGRTVAPADLEL